MISLFQSYSESQNNDQPRVGFAFPARLYQLVEIESVECSLLFRVPQGIHLDQLEDQSNTC